MSFKIFIESWSQPIHGWIDDLSQHDLSKSIADLSNDGGISAGETLNLLHGMHEELKEKAEKVRKEVQRVAVLIFRQDYYSRGLDSLSSADIFELNDLCSEAVRSFGSIFWTMDRLKSIKWNLSLFSRKVIGDSGRYYKTSIESVRRQVKRLPQDDVTPHVNHCIDMIEEFLTEITQMAELLRDHVLA